MSRFHSICFVALLLLNTVTCVLAESSQEYARLLAGDKDGKTLTVSNKDGAKKNENFFYEDGIKFTAVYPESCLQKQEDVIRFNLMLDECNLSFLWSFYVLEFEGGTLHENYVDHRGKDVPVEITNLVRMNGGEKGSTRCTNGLKKDSKVNIAVSGGSGCRGLSLVFDNDVCKDIKPPSPPSTPRKVPSKPIVKESDLSTPLLVLIIVGSFFVLILIVIAVALFVYFFIMQRCSRYYSSSSSSSSGRSHRRKDSTRSSVQSVVITGKTKKGHDSEPSKKTPVLKTAINKSPKKTQKKPNQQQQQSQLKKPDQRHQQLSQMKKKHASSPVSTKKVVE